MPKVCKLHAEQLRSGSIEIRRGMPPGPPTGYFEAEKTLFPHAKTFELGGCLISPDDKDTRRVQFCPACRDAKSAWMSGRYDDYGFWS